MCERQGLTINQLHTATAVLVDFSNYFNWILSHFVNCISLILSTLFLLFCQLYFSYAFNCISLILLTVFLLYCQLYFSYSV